MIDTTSTQMIRQSEPAKSEQTRQQGQKNDASPFGSRTQQRQAGSPGQCTATGRKPLFRS
jgi:hypothetical protein